MREFKLARDIVLIVTCVFVVGWIWANHESAYDKRVREARQIINHELGIQ